MSLRQQLGAAVYDWPRFLRHLPGDWTLIRNRDERIVSDGRGVVCQWPYTSDLHIARVSRAASRMLLRRVLAHWPIVMSGESPALTGTPEVSFLIGHRGMARVPNLLATLRSIAGQRDASIECIVVEQSHVSQIRELLPSWVRYLHTPVEADLDYNRSATFNAAAQVARGGILMFHDNDLLVPAHYAAETVARVRDGSDFIDAKRFLFYLGDDEARRVMDGGALDRATPETVVQNLKGGSVAATRSAYDAIGGFDEEFVGWGGEDLEFWERVRAHGNVYEFGYLPMIHLWHAPQTGKVDPARRPAHDRYFALRDIPPADRTRRLLDQRRAPR